MLRTSKFTPEFVPVTHSGSALSASQDGEGPEYKELTTDPREGMLNEGVLKLALSKLAPMYRDAFLLREFEGYSYEEIAEVANTSVMNVKVRITRAKKRLRQLLAPYFGNDPSGKSRRQRGASEMLAALDGETEMTDDESEPEREEDPTSDNPLNDSGDETNAPERRRSKRNRSTEYHTR